jgi:hypothetical protein
MMRKPEFLTEVRSPFSSRDPETEKVAGGLLGRTYLGLLTMDKFFLPEDLRRGRLGSRMLVMAEEEAGGGDAPARCCPHSTFRRLDST